MNPRHAVIRWLTPLVWRFGPGRKIETLQRFSLVEKDSGCQMLRCQRLVADPKLKGYLFQHVLEEFFHAELFAELAKSLAERHLYEKLLPRSELVGDGLVDQKKIRDFFAYVHVGEQAVNRDFLVYSSASLEPKIKSVFRVAGEDEGRHEKDTDDILLELCNNDAGIFFRALWKARLKRWWTLYSSATKGIGALPLGILLSLVYFFTGTLAAPALKRRLQLPRQEQLDAFQRQVADFERELR
jgi:hypothetical protein